MELPAVDHRLDVAEALRCDDRDHPLLRLRDHHLPRLHAVLALRHAVEVDVDPVVGRHLRERRGEPGGAAVLEREHEAALDELGRHLDQPLAGERVADLDGRPLVGVVLAELGAREHRRPADPVAAGRGAVEHEERPRGGRLRAHEPLDRQQSDAHRVDEAVGRVGVVEDDLAADVRHPDAVAIVANTADRAGEVVVGRAEAQAVEQRHRPRPHRGDVAQDPADAGGGALERLDGRGVVVALDLERDREAVAEIEHAGVLAGALEHARAVARQAPEEKGGVLVAAVLRPQEGEHGELEVVGLPPEQRDDASELPVREAELTMERLFRDRAQEVSLAGDRRRSARRSGGRGSVARCTGARSSSCSPSRRSGERRFSSSSSVSTRSSPRSSSSDGWSSVSPCSCRWSSCAARSRTCARCGSRASCSVRSTTRCRTGSSRSRRRGSTRVWRP